MSGLFLTLSKRGAMLLPLTALGAILLAGCSGGGGNGNTTVLGGTTGTSTGTTTGTNTGTSTGGVTVGTSAVTGKVVTAAGDPVPGATVIPDTGGVIATTVSQGGYRLDGLSNDVVHRITAAATVNGVNYTGSTQVLTLGGSLVSNTNILLSQQGEQATLTGHVTDATHLDSSGNPLPVSQARVFLTVPNNVNYSSLVAYTDSNGLYTLPSVPVNLPTVTPIQVAASLEHYSNQSFPITGLQAGGTYSQNFSLTPSTNQSINTPSLTAVTASTQPSSVFTSASNLRPRTASTASAGSVYTQIRRLLCPAYARMASGHAASKSKRLTPLLTGGFAAYAIETDVTFDNSAQVGSLLSYTVYRTSGTTGPTATSAIYDVLQDPLANVYTDIDPSYLPDKQYNFALSASNTDFTSTPLSNTLSVVPLELLTLKQPTTDQTLANNVTISWTLVSSATKYYVFVYPGDQFPSINATPVALTSTPLSAATNSYTLPAALVSGQYYYAVVVGTADQTEGSSTTGATVTVPNAVMTFSQITRFHVQ